jgi:hypothetical protein
MDLPDGLVLKKIQTQNAYYDRKSKEKFTNIIKPKYKLAGNILLEIYTFFVLTTEEQACQKFLTLKIMRDDWEDRNPNYLKASCSYLDIKKVEVLNKNEILQKCRDKQNGFPCVAKLCDKQFKQLRELRAKIQLSHRPVPTKITNLIFQALEEAKPADKIIDRLDLS